MLKINNVTFGYSRHKAPVIENFSLEIPAGGIYGLLGPNGAGKSTLLYLISGALTPKKGEVLFKDKNTRRRLPSVLSDMFLVPEEFSLPPISFEEYVKLNEPFFPNFSREDLKRNLETFNLSLTDNLGNLSMGQKKKAYMCFALATNTSLLLMDEPTNGLDIPGKSSFRRFIASAMTDNRTIIISTHQVRDIERLLDHVIIMNRNEVLFNKSIDETSRRLQFFVTDNKDVIDGALFTQPGLEGSQVITANTDGSDTSVNLETLFELALSNPVLLNSQFNHHHADNE
ncbi:MAG: ATP-binding cassette domain-containing protein [Firmicutes bacterium]|nr:ATP-binding cassette domain-containing protein [Bacillota bacterium]MCM1401218.1 ATP-binding cassette domain-containing protein [Bacteroides sp.]MCM1477085.1 ATP-binding cassette domain-containing protein [Bacteroides sp.]